VLIQSCLHFIEIALQTLHILAHSLLHWLPPFRCSMPVILSASAGKSNQQISCDVHF
jgi:hypothetical protein